MPTIQPFQTQAAIVSASKNNLMIFTKLIMTSL